MKLQDIADALCGVSSNSTPPDVVNRFFTACSSVASFMNVFYFVDSGTPQQDAAMIIKSAILQKFEKIKNVIVSAAAFGYILPGDPTTALSQINKNRQFGTPINDQPQLVDDIAHLSKIVDEVEAGRIKFEKSYASSQISSFEVSVDGMSRNTDDALLNIIGYQPDADVIKRKRALESLSKLDFSNRKPYLLFTADIIEDGKKDGTIVCWQKMRDASGFSISKRDVFLETDFPEITFSHSRILEETAKLKLKNDFMQLIMMYDWLGQDDYLAFVDNSTHGDTLYSYAVSGLQKKAPSNMSLFDVKSTALLLSDEQTLSLKTLVSEGMTPYSALSQLLYGDESYGWIVAGCNVLSSRRIGDQIDKTRTLTLIGSNIDVILLAVQNGKFVIPSSVFDVQTLVESAIQSYGISQVLLSILDGTGLTFFISGKDNADISVATKQSLENSSSGLARILSVIDAESATMDTSKLLSALLARNNVAGRYKTIQLFANSKPQENIEDEIEKEIIDMTTYIGLSKLMNIISLVYNKFPGLLTE